MILKRSKGFGIFLVAGVLMISTANGSCCADDESTFQIATFNIRYGTAEDNLNEWKRRKSILFECIRQMKPGIMGTQECLSFQLDEIKEVFPGWDHLGLGRYHSTYTRRQHEQFSGEHCAIFYDCTEFRLERSGTFWLSDTPDVPGSRTWGNGLPRIVTWGILHHKKSNHSLATFNTHYETGKNNEFVTESTKLITRKIHEISAGLPAVLMGDFNLTPDCDAHSILTGFLSDVWASLGKPERDAGTSHSFTGNPEKRIDWILVSPELKALSIDRITYNQKFRFPSDHFPLLAAIKFK